jgi:OFA family oxalate/formate antiporter-like MFS transporter
MRLRRYYILAAVIVMELLLGFQYAWGVFDRVLQEQYEFTASQAQSVLAAQIVLFAATFPLAGWVLHRFGPRTTTLIGGVLYGAALILGSVFGRHPGALFWSTGVLFGIGLSLAYISPIVTIQKWFPRYKGIATGLVVAFYGSSSFLAAAIAKALLARGMSAFEILGIFGIAAVVGIVPLSFVLTNPPGGEVESRKARFPKGVLVTGHFWALTAGYFAGTTAGLAIVGSVERIGRTLETPEVWLGMAVMAFAAGNTLGRVAWGVLSEVLGTGRAVVAALVMQGACIAGMIVFGWSGPAFVALTFGVAFGYGANFVLYITDVSRTYGADRVGSVYSLVALVYIASGFLGAPSAGYSFDRWQSYVPSMLFAATLCALGAAAFIMLHRHPVQQARDGNT